MVKNNIKIDNLKSLEIGDKIPEVIFTDIKNYKKDAIKLSDFKGKYLIIDFWSKGCTVCIEAFPKMEKLKEQFGDQLEILLLTHNTRKELAQLFEKSFFVKNTYLPMAINDSILNRIFPHEVEPFHVWVDKDGVVRAITDGWNATQENVQTFVSGKTINLPIRKDILDVYDRTKPLLDNFQGKLFKDLKYYSNILSRLEGINGTAMSAKIDLATRKKVGLTFVNWPILSLYMRAFEVFYPDRVMLEVKNPKSYFRPKDANELDAWSAQNLFSYESLMPLSMSDSLNVIMQQDLTRFFGITGSIEKRTVNCLLLVRTSKLDKLKSVGGNLVTEKRKDGTFVIRNAPIKSIVNLLMVNNSSPIPSPVVDETSYIGNIDIDIKAAFDDLPTLRRELKRYDLDLIEAPRALDMLVLRERR